jgi:hypothetical protein
MAEADPTCPIGDVIYRGDMSPETWRGLLALAVPLGACVGFSDAPDTLLSKEDPEQESIGPATAQDFALAAATLGVDKIFARKAWWSLVKEFRAQINPNVQGQRNSQPGKVPLPVRLFLTHPPKGRPWGDYEITDLDVASLGEYVSNIDEVLAGRTDASAEAVYRNELARNVAGKTVEFWRKFVQLKLKDDTSSDSPCIPQGTVFEAP